MNAPLLIVTSDQHKVSCVRPDIHKIKVFILGIKGVRILFVFFAGAWPAMPVHICKKLARPLCERLDFGGGCYRQHKNSHPSTFQPAGQIVE